MFFGDERHSILSYVLEAVYGGLDAVQPKAGAKSPKDAGDWDHHPIKKNDKAMCLSRPSSTNQNRSRRLWPQSAPTPTS